jgi:uncharacterized protein
VSIAASAERTSSHQGSRVQRLAWLVTGDKAGDNGQIEVIGEALARRPGWMVARRRLEMLPEWVTGKPRVVASLHHLDIARSDPLEPPWPDLIVTIGRRPSMAALWVRERSGGKTRIVRVGKPTGSADLFDLVVVSAEVQIAARSNVLRIGLPLMRIDADSVAAEAAARAGEFEAMPRPLIGMLIGGPTGPYRFDEPVIQRLLGTASGIAAAGGTPFVTTSRRTPPLAVRALEQGLPTAARLHRWRADAIDNPYRALLGLADGFVVTGDSISMMVEVARLGRPLQIARLSHAGFGRLDLWRRRGVGFLFERAERTGWREIARAAGRLGLAGQTRDFEAFHRMLEARGLAAPLGGPFEPPRGRAGDDVGAVVDRIEALVPQPRT